MKDIWTHEFPVNTYDADFNRKLKISTIFNNFQHAAADHAADLGVGYSDLSAASATWVLIRVKALVDRYPQMGTQVKVMTWPKGGDNLIAVRDFTMADAEGSVFCRGTSHWLIADAVTLRPQRLSKFRMELPLNAGMNGLDETPGKINIDFGDAEEAMTHRANYSETDVNRHVNNARYADWIMDSFDIGQFEKAEIGSIQINYLSQVLPGTVVRLMKKRLPGTERFAVAGLSGEGADSVKHFESIVEWRLR